MLFEKALPLCHSEHVLSTLSLVQVKPTGKSQDLLSPELEDLSVLDVAPLGLACSLLTLTVTWPGPDPPERPGTQHMWRGTLRILQLPGDQDCPLLRALAGEVAGKELEGSLHWIVSWLLDGNNYSRLLLRLNPQGSSLSLLQAALMGASGRRMQVKQVRPTLWDAIEEAQARRASLKILHLGLLGDTLTDSGLNQLGRALRELQVIKVWKQCPRSQIPKGTKAETMGLPKPQAQQVPDVALQFFLAHAQRQRLQDQHQIWIQEELKRLEQEVGGEQVNGLMAEEKASENKRWHWEQTVLRLQVEALQAEWDIAEQDLAALYDLHVQATQARTCHILQVFRAWQGLWEEQAMTTEHCHRSLLAAVLQDTIDLALKNQELQAQTQQLQQDAHEAEAVKLHSHPGENPDQEPYGVVSFFLTLEGP
ncbi:uncharacterized protein [Castor canadensis]|uniref:Uncharacterized protein n=1 Tax=Castor canadensis TaxID=51338 RepID=A0AC58MUA8_CASCN